MLRSLGMQEPGKSRSRGGAALTTLALCLALLALAPTAGAAPPIHSRTPALDVEGLNRACGAAVDPEGNVYAASEGESKIKVFGTADHEAPIAEIANENGPCGLAVDSRGDLFVLETESGEVVRYVPGEFPFEGAPSYGPREVIDPSGEARGIAVDTSTLWTNSNRAAGGDDTLFVAKGNRIEARANEAQQVKISGSGGTYKLLFGGEETAPLPSNASHAEVQEALEALAAIGGGNVAVTTANFGATDHRIAFTRALGLTDVDRIEVDTGELSASASTALLVQGGLGTNEEQRVQLRGATGGSFTLSFEGQTTAPIGYEPSPAEIQAALEALSNLEPGDVAVRREPSGSTNFFSIVFRGAYAATDVAQIETSTALSPDEVQQVTVDATAGTYTLTFDGQTTGPIAYNATAAQLEEALEELSNVEPGDVAVTGGPGGPGGENPYLVTFEGAYAGTNVAQMGRDQSLLTGTASVATITNGPELSASTIVQGWSGRIGEGTLGEATGVAAYTHPVGEAQKADRYVFAADAATDRIEVFGGPRLADLKARKEIEGPEGGFGFGAGGTHLAADPGNALEEKTLKCVEPVNEQACTAGHLIVFDAAHEAVQEYDAGGHFLDSFGAGAIADAEPTALAIDRSGGAGDGTIYVGSGAGAGAELLAFGPLGAPSRELLPELSQTLEGAGAVATDAYGNVYVAAGSTVHVYGPDGKEIAVGPEGKGFGLDEPTGSGLEVDSTGRVYVFSPLEIEPGKPPEQRVGYYTPSAYPPEAGTTYGGPTIVIDDKTLSDETGERTIASFGVDPGNDRLFAGGGGRVVMLGSAAEGSPILDECFACGLLDTPTDIAVGGEGEVYAAVESGKGRPGVIDPSGSEVWARASGAGSPLGYGLFDAELAVDLGNGHMLAFNDEREVAEEYDASGAFVAEFGTFTPLLRDSSVAVDNGPESPNRGTVYVAFDDTAPETFDLTAFGPLEYGTPPGAVTGVAAGLGEGNATLNGTVNPNGYEVTNCHFEYLSDTEYEESGMTFSGATSVPCAPGVAELGKGSAPVPVHADIGGLDPEGRYRFRVVAENKYGLGEGGAWLFGPLRVEAKTALPVSYTEATLRGEIDTAGQRAEYHFEYTTQEQFEAEGFAGAQSTPDRELPAGEEPVAVQAPLTGLAEGTEYRLRLLAANAAYKAEAEGLPFATLERALTQECPNSAYRTGLSAKLPDCRAYELVSPPDTRGSLLYTGRLRTAGEGFNDWLSPPRGEGAGERLSYFVDGTLPGFDGSGRFDGYTARRGSGLHPDEGWTSRLFGPTYAQAGGGLPTQRGVAADQDYSLWNLGALDSFEGTLPQGVYLRTPAGFEAIGRGSFGEDLEADGRFVSPGGTHAIFTSDAHLEPDAPVEGTTAIYDRAAGAPSAAVVSAQPGGGSFGAGEDAVYVGASEDGSAVAFRVGGTLYLHRGEGTVEVAEAPNSFAGLAADGSRLFYSREGTLFFYDATSGESAEIAKGASFVSVSPKGTAVLLSSEAALTPGSDENELGQHAEAGALNLYRWDGAGLGFVAALDPADMDSFGGDDNVDLAHWPQNLTEGGVTTFFGRGHSPTRATPDGSVFVFQSHARLGDYDNEGHGEIYRYAPTAAVGERLLCVSCDPGGAPPGADAMLQIVNDGLTGARAQIANVTDDGRRVFFHSSDQLLPEDANVAVDVYEWTARGLGGCERLGGCLALISSGQGGADSRLYAMSADGHDVFIATAEKLIGRDVVGSPSLYDAREFGGIPEAPPDEECEGDACQGPSAAPPALSPRTTTGPGETPRTSKRRCARGRRLVKGHCVRKKRRHRARRHRSHRRHRAHHNRRHGRRAAR